uniref:1-(5-phosphoribosyl)-5-((5-phosphoribosylamino)methylideneamino)imidazole-4-carboxamide isomerase n=1 Tax=Parastrongyloides trichosuri TaxID=131310 RepID=A0A0N4ZKZ1_PARTI
MWCPAQRGCCERGHPDRLRLGQCGLGAVRAGAAGRAGADHRRSRRCGRGRKSHPAWGRRGRLRHAAAEGVGPDRAAAPVSASAAGRLPRPAAVVRRQRRGRRGRPAWADPRPGRGHPSRPVAPLAAYGVEPSYAPSRRPVAGRRERRRLGLFRPRLCLSRWSGDAGRRRLRRARARRGQQRQPLGLPVPPGTVGRRRRAYLEELPGVARVIIYPAIDLIEGHAVRLLHGDFNHVTRYDSHPANRLAAFAAEGAKWIHVIDLDGAKAGEALGRRRPLGKGYRTPAGRRDQSCRHRLAGRHRHGSGAEMAGAVRPRRHRPGPGRPLRGRPARARPEGLDPVVGRGSVERAGPLSGRNAAPHPDHGRRSRRRPDRPEPRAAVRGHQPTPRAGNSSLRRGGQPGRPDRRQGDRLRRGHYRPRPLRRPLHRGRSHQGREQGSGRPRGQGRAVRGPRRHGRRRRTGRALSRSGRGRTGLLRHHGQPRGADAGLWLGAGHRPAAGHPLLRGGRHPHGGAGGALSRPRRGQGVDQLARAGAARTDRRDGAAAGAAMRRRRRRQRLSGRRMAGAQIHRRSGCAARRGAADDGVDRRGAGARRRRDRAELHRSGRGAARL